MSCIADEIVISADGQSKLCNVLFAAELHRRERAAGTGVTACSLHPGSFIPTDIGRGRWYTDFAIKAIARWVTKTISQGAATTVFCALAPAEVLQGDYFLDCAPRQMSDEATSRVVAGQLWTLSERLCQDDDGIAARSATDMVSPAVEEFAAFMRPKL